MVVACRNHVLYEPIKDFALDRVMRSDIWVRQPAEMTAETAELLGGFSFGITMPRSSVPSEYQAQGKLIDLSAPLYGKLIDLMSILPISIGDFLAHPAGVGTAPAKVVEALQILVACGIVYPMRGLRGSDVAASIAQPRLSGSFNRGLDKIEVTGGDVLLSSSILGCAVAIPAREALVMQALNRVGLADLVSALMPELLRLAKKGAHIIDSDKELTPETARIWCRMSSASRSPSGMRTACSKPHKSS